jgi:hypothetical protein
MSSRLGTWARENTRQALAAVLAPALLVLAVDVGIAHFAGTGNDQLCQYAPVWYGIVGFAVLLTVALPGISPRIFTIALRAVGALGLFVGMVGTGQHATRFFAELEGKYTLAQLEGALSTSPPLFAPAAFLGLGAALIVLASPRLTIRFGAAGARPGAGDPALSTSEPGAESTMRKIG